MDNDDSNDVIAVECIESSELPGKTEDENRPIMKLFKRLISDNNSQSTVLTNAQIIELLQKEYDMNVAALHPLEVDIYLNIVKKFLKDWPHWDEFDSVILRLKSIKAFSAIKRILDNKYKNLKEYLRVMLEASKPLARSICLSTDKILHNKIIHDSNGEHVVMKLNCSRQELYNLILKHPSKETYTIFSLSSPLSQHIIVNSKLTLAAILNWWDIALEIDLKVVAFQRKTTHRIKRTLVNMTNQVPTDLLPVNTTLQMKNPTLKRILVQKFQVQEFFNLFLRNAKHLANRSLIQLLTNLIRNEWVDYPEVLYVSSSYRQQRARYPYTRLLVNNDDSETDLNSSFALEEQLVPTVEYTITKYNNLLLESIREKFDAPFILGDWLQVTCIECKRNFTNTSNLTETLLDHFNECHYNESPWKCSNCACEFPMHEIASLQWQHRCGQTSK